MHIITWMKLENLLSVKKPFTKEYMLHGSRCKVVGAREAAKGGKAGTEGEAGEAGEV